MMNAKKSSKSKLTRYAFVLPAVITCLLTFSFSKAELIKKSKVAYKTITASVERINPAHILSDSLKNDTIKIIAKKAKGKNVYSFSGDSSKKMNIVIVDGKVESFDTYNPSKDTLGKRGGIVRRLQLTRDLKNDSNIVIYVNGVKRTDLKGLDPADIQTINIHGDTTGKRLTKVRINGKPITGLTGTSTINLDYDYSYTPDDKNERVIVGHPSRNVTIAGGRNVVFRKTITVDTLTGDAKLFRGEPLMINMMRKKEVSIDHISDKLIIIDGKEATPREFKKLSAADIESMSAKSGDEVTKQYGDKAKNGVLMITTKKSR